MAVVRTTKKDEVVEDTLATTRAEVVDSGLVDDASSAAVMTDSKGDGLPQDDIPRRKS